MFSLDWKSGGDRANAGSFGGYLYKLKRKQKMVLSQWNRRYFSIEGTNLRWYENDATSTPSGAVDLSQVTDINEFQSGKSSCSFIIKCSERNLMLRAENSNEMDKWLRILRQSTSYAQGGNGTSCDFRGAGPSTKAKALAGSNSLANKLDKALDGLNQLEADILAENHEAVKVDISNRINANANAEAAVNSNVATQLPEAGRLIRSSDSEICMGKMHAPLPYQDPKKPVHRNTQFSSDQEIVVGKSNPNSPAGMNSSAISYFGADDDGADDGVVDFDELPDEEEFLYQERLVAARYGTGGGNTEPDGKGDHVSAAAAASTSDAKMSRRQTPPSWNSTGNGDSKSYEAK